MGRGDHFCGWYLWCQGELTLTAAFEYAYP